MADISDAVKELVESKGDKVAVNEPPCVLWKAEHKNCKGCEYELGCGKLVRMMGAMLLSSVYKPNGFKDFQRMQNRIEELTTLIMDARTAEELRIVPMV